MQAAMSVTVIVRSEVVLSYTEDVARLWTHNGLTAVGQDQAMYCHVAS